ncbi:MAG TPA: response regulator [Sunxiuqinia sp.]|nr:response regulator [Sunxiuqinia sp.]
MNKTSHKEKKTFLDLFFPKMENYAVVVIDDDEYFNKLLVQALQDFSDNMRILYQANIKVHSYPSAKRFLDAFKNHKFDRLRCIFFIDYFLERNMDATDLLRVVNKHPNHHSVIVSEQKNYQTSEETILLGAEEFIRKNQFTSFMSTTVLEQFIREDVTQ